MGVVLASWLNGLNGVVKDVVKERPKAECFKMNYSSRAFGMETKGEKLH